MSSQLVEIKCEHCGKVYMGEIDNDTGKFYGGCPHCKDRSESDEKS